MADEKEKSLISTGISHIKDVVVNQESIEDIYNILANFFPPIVAGAKSTYDFIKNARIRSYEKKLYWFAKNAKIGNINEEIFVSFFNNNGFKYDQLLDILTRLDTEDAVSDFVKIFDALMKEAIDHKLFNYFVYVITHWMLTDKDTMIELWKFKGSPIVTVDMHKTKLINVDESIGYQIIEPLKRLMTYGLVTEILKAKLKHKGEADLEYSYTYSKNAMILCSIIGRT